MTRLTLTLGVSALAALAITAQPTAAREVKLTTVMARNFIGGAYAVLYLVDAEGKYETTFHVFGTTQRYYLHLRNWYRATDLADVDNFADADGKSGPSVRRGEVAEISVEIADELFDKGYMLRIDSTLYEGRDYGTDAEVPLATTSSGVEIEGRGYVKTLRLDL